MHGESFKKLKKIKIKDCGEPLVLISKYCPKVLFGNKIFGPTLKQKPMYVRKKVAEKLADASKLLPEEILLLIVDAWRSVDDQRKIYRRFYNRLKRENPKWPESVLRRVTNEFVFNPDEGIVPYHATGGTVDITLCNQSGRKLKMWSKKLPAEKQTKLFPEGIPEEIKINRELLAKVLSKVGLTNYPSEWWHWSYGCSGWALRCGKKSAIYGEISPK